MRKFRILAVFYRKDESCILIPRLLVLCVIGMITLVCVSQGMAQTQEFSNWPEGASPAEVGKRVAENYVAAAWRITQAVGPLPRGLRLDDGPDLGHADQGRGPETGLIQKFDPLLAPEGASVISRQPTWTTGSSGSCPWRSTCRPRTSDTWRSARGWRTSSGRIPTRTGSLARARYLDRRHVHDHDPAGPGLPRHG